MLFAIRGYSDTYKANNGIEGFIVVECLDEKEAEEIGKELSIDVIESYSFIVDMINEDVADRLGYEMYELNPNGVYDYPNYDIVYNESLMEEVAYEVVELDENYDVSLEYLNSLDWDTIVSKYSK